MDGLAHIQRRGRKQRHQRPAAAVCGRHEVRQADDPQALQRHLAQRLAAGRGDAGLDVHAGATGIAQGPVVQGLGLGEPQQRMLGELAEVPGRAMAPQVVGAGQHPHTAAAHGAGVQRGIFQCPDAEGHIGAFFQQVDEALVRGQLQLHLRVALAKARDQRHQHMQHERGGGIDPQPAGRARAACRHQLFGLVHGRQDGAGTQQEGGTFLGQFQAPRGAAQQRGLQLVFQPGQGAAGGRHRQPQQLCRGRDGARIDHGHQGLQLIEGGFHC